MLTYLIPIDFSDSSINAFHYGHQLAGQLGATVRVIHSYFPSSPDIAGSAFIELDVQQKHQEILQDFVKKTEKQNSVKDLKVAPIEHDFRIGFPGVEILQAAKEHKVDIIIMGTEGNSGMLKKLFGSVSTKIMKEAKCPVLVVPPNTKPTQIKKILYTTSESNIDDHCIKPVMEFAESLNASVTLLHVVDDLDDNSYSEIYELVKINYPNTDIDYQTIFHSNIVRGMLNFASEYEIDLIAMGTKNRNLFDGLFHKSITKEMSMHSKTPLLILK